MCDTGTTKLPASWAELGTKRTAEAATNGNHNGNGISKGAKASANGVSSDMDGLHQSFVQGKAVRTVYGLVPFEYALDWPLFASYDELAGCASWMGGRIPTFEEAKSLYTHATELKKEQAERKLGKTVPAVNGSVPHPSHAQSSVD